jgi:hypothetical protein
MDQSQSNNYYGIFAEPGTKRVPGSLLFSDWIKYSPKALPIYLEV